MADIIVLRPGARDEDIENLIEKLKGWGLIPKVMQGEFRKVIACIGDTMREGLKEAVEAFNFVEKVLYVMQPYKFAAKDANPEGTRINVREGLQIGGEDFIVMAGPCSVESEEQILRVAREVKSAGAKVLRGGAFKPRTSPYSFQGLGEEGLKLLRKASEETGLAIVTEVMDTRDTSLVAEYSDIIQIGARNSQNYPLLKEVGRSGKPVLLKKGMSMPIEELLLSAEYILSEGNPNVILCERGIKTFETATRNTLDISAVPVLNEKTHLPVIVDPSHGTGKRSYVPAMACAACAAGADGLLVEVHPEPEKALSDGAQSLTIEEFSSLMEKVKKIAQVVGRKV